MSEDWTQAKEDWTQAKEVVHTTSATPYLTDVAPQASSTLLNQAHLWLFCSISSVFPSLGATSLSSSQVGRQTSIFQQEADK